MRYELGRRIRAGCADWAVRELPCGGAYSSLYERFGASFAAKLNGSFSCFGTVASGLWWPQWLDSASTGLFRHRRCAAGGVTHRRAASCRRVCCRCESEGDRQLHELRCEPGTGNDHPANPGHSARDHALCSGKRDSSSAVLGHAFTAPKTSERASGVLSERLERLVERVVAARIRPDATGAYLSGATNSSTVLGMMIRSQGAG